MSLHVEEQARKRPDCPFCKGAIADGSRTWECPACATLHHEDCARENGQCTVLGCTGAPPRPPAEPLRVFQAPQQRDPALVPVAVFVGLLLVVGLLVFGGIVASPPRTPPPPDPQRVAARLAHDEAELLRLLRSVLSAQASPQPLSSNARQACDATFNEALRLYQGLTVPGPAGPATDPAALRARIRVQLASAPLDRWPVDQRVREAMPWRFGKPAPEAVDGLVEELAQGRER